MYAKGAPGLEPGPITVGEIADYLSAPCYAANDCDKRRSTNRGGGPERSAPNTAFLLMLQRKPHGKPSRLESVAFIPDIHAGHMHKIFASMTRGALEYVAADRIVMCK